MNRRASSTLTALLVVLLWPTAAWASVPAFWGPMYVLAGLAYTGVLFAIGILALVYVLLGEHRPVFGGVLLFGASICTLVYLVIPLGVLWARGFLAHFSLYFCPPVLALTIPVAIFGHRLRRASTTPRSS